jgi:hypothetical protein
LGKARGLGEIDQNVTKLRARAFPGKKNWISLAFWLEYDQNYDSGEKIYGENQVE